MINYEKLIIQAKKDGIEKFVVGAIIIKEDKILLLERPENDFMGGIYEFPSGNVEKNETLKEGLIRETKEETGLDIISADIDLGHFDYKSSTGKNSRQFNFFVTVSKTEPIILTEHDSYIWIDVNKLKEYPITDAIKEVVNLYLRLKN